MYLVCDKSSGVALITLHEFALLQAENRAANEGADTAAGTGAGTEAVMEGSLQSTLYWDLFPEDVSTLRADALPGVFSSDKALDGVFL